MNQSYRISTTFDTLDGGFLEVRCTFTGPPGQSYVVTIDEKEPHWVTVIPIQKNENTILVADEKGFDWGCLIPAFLIMIATSLLTILVLRWLA